MLHRVKRKLAALVKGNTPGAVLTKPASSWQGSAVWEDMISLKSQEEPDFEVLSPAKEYYEQDTRKADFENVDYMAALEADVNPLPMTKDREGYYGSDHFSYWASGFQDAQNVLKAADQYKIPVNDILDLGCASGRVIRHIAGTKRNIQTYGCDINRLHVEWCNRYLPGVIVFHSHSVPNLPMKDNSLDVVMAFSVFTHIEAFETAWLMEINRVLRPGGLAWITVHTQDTLIDMDEEWPLWKPVMNHPDTHKRLDENRHFHGDRMVIRWQRSRSYASNVFYKKEYLHNVCGKFFDVLELRRRFPRFQEAMLLQAKK